MKIDKRRNNGGNIGTGRAPNLERAMQKVIECYRLHRHKYTPEQRAALAELATVLLTETAELTEEWNGEVL